jgi:hypothetical protein
MIQSSLFVLLLRCVIVALLHLRRCVAAFVAFALLRLRVMRSLRLRCCVCVRCGRCVDAFDVVFDGVAIVDVDRCVDADRCCCLLCVAFALICCVAFDVWVLAAFLYGGRYFVAD